VVTSAAAPNVLQDCGLIGAYKFRSRRPQPSVCVAGPVPRARALKNATETNRDLHRNFVSLSSEADAGWGVITTQVHDSMLV